MLNKEKPKINILASQFSDLFGSAQGYYYEFGNNLEIDEFKELESIVKVFSSFSKEEVEYLIDFLRTHDSSRPVKKLLNCLKEYEEHAGGMNYDEWKATNTQDK